MGSVLRRLALAIAGFFVVVAAAGLTYGLLAGFNLRSADGSALPQLLSERSEALEKDQSQPEDKAEDYTTVAYYREQYDERYQAYGQMHAELEQEAVVCRVNMGLDRPFYDGAVEIDNVQALPLLVNKYHYLPKNYAPADLMLRSDGFYLSQACNEAFLRLDQAAGLAGYPLAIKTAYRSMAEQEQLHASFARTYSSEQLEKRVARPGFSEHHTGYALDIYAKNEPGAFENTKTYQWVQENCWQYGFIMRYPQGYDDITGYQYEPWHITYVGQRAAAMMQQRGVRTLEEYFAMDMADNG